MTQSTRPAITIRPAAFPEDEDVVRTLFTAYAKSINVNLDYQNFDAELAGLPGKYAVENGGAVYLASIPGAEVPRLNGNASLESATSSQNGTNSAPTEQPKEQVIGCVGLRALPNGDSKHKSELKRLYLTPESRGLGAAKLLMQVVIEQARTLGYREMYLDTLSSMTAARGLYASFGFEEVESYYDSVSDAVYYRLVL
jgi:ribosomal protein S18 acetylase RimI-like enzyme